MKNETNPTNIDKITTFYGRQLHFSSENMMPLEIVHFIDLKHKRQNRINPNIIEQTMMDRSKSNQYHKYLYY
jgi:hypothetical protein